MCCCSPSFLTRSRPTSLTLAATDYALRAVIVPFIAALKVQASHPRARGTGEPRRRPA
jgi:hypothetical protein